MVKLTVSLHPKGLPPLQAMKAWVLRIEEGLSWPEIQQRTTNVLGETAGDKAVREAVACKEAMEEGALVPKTKYTTKRGSCCARMFTAGKACSRHDFRRTVAT